MDNDSITLERARREQLVMQTVNELRDDALIDVEKKRNRCTQIRCGIVQGTAGAGRIVVDDRCAEEIYVGFPGI